MRKPDFCICENKDADQLRGKREADQRLCFGYTDSTFATRIYFLYTKFQASNHLVWLYSLVCVGVGQKPRKLVFSQRGSYHNNYILGTSLYKYNPRFAPYNCQNWGSVLKMIKGDNLGDNFLSP